MHVWVGKQVLAAGTRWFQRDRSPCREVMGRRRQQEGNWDHKGKRQGVGEGGEMTGNRGNEVGGGKPWRRSMLCTVASGVRPAEEGVSELVLGGYCWSLCAWCLSGWR